jgi:hypothetical protein
MPFFYQVFSLRIIQPIFGWRKFSNSGSENMAFRSNGTLNCGLKVCLALIGVLQRRVITIPRYFEGFRSLPF